MLVSSYFRYMRSMAVAAALLALVGGCARQHTEGGPTPPATAEILIRDTAVAPGGSSELGLLIVLADGWHTYTDPPGDSGMPPMFDITWPDGVIPGTALFPAHKAFTDTAGTTFGFEGAVLVRLPFTVADTIPPGTTLSLAGQVDYLICREICTAQSAPVDISFTVATEKKQSEKWSKAAQRGGWKGK